MLAARTQPSEDLPLDDMRRRVRDLFEPKPWLYWTDFLFHITLTWVAFAITVQAALWSPLQVLAYLVSVFALYRSVIFIHELAHLKRGSFGMFRWVWNLLCGLPTLLPSYVYSGVHNHHHRKNVYGTTGDGEYYPFAARSPLEVVGFLAPSVLLPGLLVIRFVALTPIGWVSPRVRSYLWKRASSLTLDARFIRTASERDESDWRLQEALACGYGAAAIALVAGGILPWQTLVVWYLMVFGSLSVNAVRTVVAHRYRNAQRQPMTITEQFLDSVDVPGQRFVTGLWAPVGLRYHATHHLFPSMPYHNLGEAYRRLLHDYPEVYAQATRRGLLDALRQLWSDARASQRKPTVQADATGSGAEHSGGLR